MAFDLVQFNGGLKTVGVLLTKLPSQGLFCSVEHLDTFEDIIPTATMDMWNLKRWTSVYEGQDH
jgi:hypothetical protein